MTSNAEEQANTPAAVTVRPRKPPNGQRCATQAPSCARKAKAGKEGQFGRTAAQKPQGRQTGQTRGRCPRGQQGSQSPKPAEAAGQGFFERANESYRLVGAFCPWIPERICRQADEAPARVRQERERGARLFLQG